MQQFRQTMVAGVVAAGVSTIGCMNNEQVEQSSAEKRPAGVKDPNRIDSVQQSFRNYSIPLSLKELQAEVIDRKGIDRSAVAVPVGFSPRSFLAKIVSGGQTGVDRAALDFGLTHGIEIGGWCPKGRTAEDGVISRRYPLKETEEAEVTWRTEFNARDSDGSLVLVENHLMRGTGYTREMAIKHAKPYWIQPIDAPFDRAEFARWLIANEIKVLNIGGPRESDQPGSVYNNAFKILEKIFLP